MNDLVSQLLQLGPGIAAGVKGNGAGMQAFMESYQRTNQMLDEKERLQQHEQIGMEDRQRSITRQTEQDRIAAEQRANAATQQTQADALQRLQIPGQLAEAGSTAETPDDAKRLIESLMPSLMNAFGQDTMALGQPAVEMAARSITGRQKRQMKEFVEKLVGTSFVADNPEADPEIANLPEHVQKMLGKPSAKLSELQQFAELPVGKPQGKTRIPPAAGSMEEFADPNITPERKAQILADRKAYMQADDRPLAGDAGLKANQEALLTEKLAKGWNDANASGREMRRQFGLMETGLKRFRAGDKNGGSQAVLVTFQKILDPTSVVRESEYARSAAGISMLGRLQGYADKLAAGGAGVPDAELAAMVETARQMLDGMQSYANTQRSRIDAMAKKYQIDPVLIYGMEAPPSATATQTQTGTGPKPGERRKIKGQLAEWDGKGWLPVKP